MLAECCYFSRENMQAFYRLRDPRQSAGKGWVEEGLLESGTGRTIPNV